MEKLPNKEFREMVPTLREEGFYEHQEQRQIHWPEYSLSQIEDAKETIAFIRTSTETCETLDRVGKEGRPLTDPKDLTKAVLLSEFLGMPERQAEGWTSLLGAAVGILYPLDDRVIGDAYDRVEVAYLLRQIFRNNKDSDGKLMGDGTGLEKSRKQNYEEAKKYASYMISIVDSRQIVQAFELGERGECKVMKRLVEEVEGHSLRLDAGFNDRKLVKRIAEKEMIPYVFPIKSNKLNGSAAWKHMYLELYYDVMNWLIAYHQRSHTESFHSSFKRKNRLLMKRRPLAQLNQVMARIILHNCRRLAYFSRLQS